MHHHGLNATNILVRDEAGEHQVYFIDFDRADVRDYVARGTRERELRRLARSLRKLARSGLIPQADDFRVLRTAYLAEADA